MQYFPSYLPIQLDPFEQVMCPSHNQIPHTDFERVDGWLTSNGAVHGTVLEYSCQVGKIILFIARKNITTDLIIFV